MSLTATGTAHALGTNPVALDGPFSIWGWFKGNTGQVRKYLSLANSADANSYYLIGTDITSASGRGSAVVTQSSTVQGQSTGAVLGANWVFLGGSFSVNGQPNCIVGTNAKTTGGSGFNPAGINETIVSGSAGSFSSGIAGQFAHLGASARFLADLEWSYLGGGGNPRWLTPGRYWECAATETTTITDQSSNENLTCTSITAGTDDPILATYWTAAALGNQSYTQGVAITSIDWTTKFRKVAAAVDYTTSLVQRAAAGTPSTATAAATSSSNTLTLADASAFSVGGYASITTTANPLLILAKSGNTLLLGGFGTWAASANVYPFAVSAKTFTFYSSGNTFSGTPAAGDVGTFTVIPRAANTTTSTLIADGPAFQITVASSGAAPSFSAGPTLTSANSDGYTFGGTSNQVATCYLLSMVTGSTAPSQAQMLSGSPAGFVSRVTQAAGSGTPFSLSVTGLTNPIYDEYLMLNNGSGSSAIVPFTAQLKSPGATQQYVTATIRTITAVTKANPCKITSASHGLITGNQVEVFGLGGMVELNALFDGTLYPCTVLNANDITIPVDSTGFTTYTSGGSLAWGNSIDKDASTPVATGDVRILDAVTAPDGCVIICQSDGSVALQVGQVTRRQTFSANVYSKAGNTLIGATTDYFQDIPPAIADIPGTTLPAIFIQGNQTITPVNLSGLAQDPQGDVPVATVNGLSGTGLSVAASVLSGNAVPGQIIPVTVTWSNDSGESVSSPYNIVVSPITPPDLTGLLEGQILPLLTNYYLSATFGTQDDAAPAGTALAQNPPVGTPVQANTTLNVTLSTGVPPNTGGGTGGGGTGGGTTPPVVATVKSSTLQSQEAQSGQPNPLTEFTVFASISTGAADLPGSTYRFFRIPSSAIIMDIQIQASANPNGSSYSAGLYLPYGGGEIVPGSSTLLTPSGLSLDASLSMWTSIYLPSVIGQPVNVANLGKRLWELLGLKQDPSSLQDVIYDVAITANTPGQQGGLISMRLSYIRGPDRGWITAAPVR